MVSYLILIKNSGIFFLIISCVLYLYSVIRYLRQNEKITNKQQLLLLPLIIPISTLFTWSRYVNIVYSADKLGKHTMGLENYRNIFNEKTSMEIKK